MIIYQQGFLLLGGTVTDDAKQEIMIVLVVFDYEDGRTHAPYAPQNIPIISNN